MAPLHFVAAPCHRRRAVPVVVRTVDLHLGVNCRTTGLPSAIVRPPVVRLRRARLSWSGLRVVSISVGRQEVATSSYRFVAPPALVPARDQSTEGEPARWGARSAAAEPATRPTRTLVRPPRDVVKLQDRLYYLLQPPLESWLAQAALPLPHAPFPYQLQGVSFLYPRQAAILADEMGLGKTMQAITALRLLVHAGEVRRALLVCPKPLVTNWQREFAQWAPEIPLCVIEGDQVRRRWQWELAVPVKIANYELLPRDREVLAEPGVEFDLVVLDESQRIKNRRSTTAEIACSIRRRRSWALTGTPVENSPHDLVGIFEFLAPGYLHENLPPRRLGQLASDYVLRRTKEQVLRDLPPKLVRDVEMHLLPEQHETYRLAEEQGVLRLASMGQQATIQHVFELVLRLKQICNFDTATGASWKCERLIADLEEVAASRQKAIVFSQWVSTLRRLAPLLERFGPLEYHGHIPPRQRDAVLRRFREDPRAHVLLMSYGAGGVGLNLQFASYVFLFDRWWNPAVEDQAINRAHRIGAAGPVTVSRFLSLGTIEQRIDEILRNKRELFEIMFSDAAVPHRAGLTEEELFGLFQLPGGQRLLPPRLEAA
jgi:SNF2 family DNA or RNA helicase